MRTLINASKQNVIAEYLLISPSQWSRMKRGKEAITDVQLARLSQYFDVERSCDFLIWLKPFETFTLTLTTLGFGRLRHRTNGPPLKELLYGRVHSDDNELKIIPVRRSEFAPRGIGVPTASDHNPIELRPGENVRITVAGGSTSNHLVLLSQEPEGQFTVLAPLRPRPVVLAEERSIVLPDLKDVYPVGRPFGPHFLYAILTTTSLGFESKLNFDVPFPVLPQIMEAALRDELAGLEKDNCKILMRPYEVVR